MRFQIRELLLSFCALLLLTACSETLIPSDELTTPSALSPAPGSAEREYAYIGRSTLPLVSILSLPDLEFVGAFTVPGARARNLAISANGRTAYVVQRVRTRSRH